MMATRTSSNQKSSHNSEQSKNLPLIVVGVGASAGGLEAFQGLLGALGDQPSMAIVFVQHLDPSSKSLLPELLSRSTAMEVVELSGRKKLKPNAVYICPPHTLLDMNNGFVSCQESKEQRHSGTIDHFFNSIAENLGERGIGVILSGSGSDGTLGLKAISDHGGLTFAQDGPTAKFDSMPRSAAITGVADHVLSPTDIAGELLNYAKYLAELALPLTSEHRLDDIKDAIPSIAERLMDVTQHNFQHYKLNTLARRILRRMQVLKFATVSDYVDHLQHHEEEVRALFRELLIGVTAFFRDPDAFDSLREKVLPNLFKNPAAEDCLRIWVAGCASGQEAYTMAMLCREVMDEIGPTLPAVQIFATDIDERALAVARAGIYPVGIEEQISPERLKRFFVKKGKRYHVRKEIREMVLFSVHNLISDPPFSRQDLISCRNLLIYLGSHLQTKLIPLFHYALRPSGFLFLGPSENITAHAELFRALDVKQRISQRKGTSIGTSGASQYRPSPMTTRGGGNIEPDTGTDLSEMRLRITLDEFSPKSVVINEDAQILNASADMQKYLTVSGGNYQNNIVKMAARGLRIGLRAAFAEAKKTRRRVDHDDLSIRVEDLIQRVMITVQPMPRLGEDEPLFLVVFHDVGKPFKRDAPESSESRQDWRSHEDAKNLLANSATADAIIFQLERELETTRDDLDKTLQDMEASNEELKSSNEELLSMNEELQSANEELETSREEIRAGGDAIARANDDLENLLRSTQIATVFLDDNLHIRSFTPAVLEIYDLIPTDIGRPLERFVPLVHEMPPLPDSKKVAKSGSEHTIRAHSGKSYIRRVLPYQSHAGESEGIVVTFTDVTQLHESEELFQLLVDASAQIVWVTSADGVVNEDSPSWRAFTGQTLEQWIGFGWADAIHADDVEQTKQSWQAAVESCLPFSLEFRLWHHDSQQYRWTHVRAVPQSFPDGTIKRWVGMNVDINDRKNSEQQLRANEELVRTIAENSTQAMVMMDERGHVTYCNQVLLDMTGYNSKEIRSATLHDLIHHHHPDGRPYPITDCPIDRGLPEDFSVRTHEDLFFRKDGSTFEVSCAASPIFNDGKPVSTVIEIRDITQQNAVRRELANREAHLRRVIDNIIGFVGVLDTDGILLEANQTALAAGGVCRDEVIGRPFWECVWWSYDTTISQQLQGAFQQALTGEIVRYDVVVRMAGDTRLTIDFMLVPVRDNDGNITHVIPSGMDISDRTQHIFDLKLSAERLRVASQATGFGTLNVDVKARTTQFSPEFNRIIGYSEGHDVALRPDVLPPFVHPDDAHIFLRHYREAHLASEDDDAAGSEYRIVRPNGEHRWVRLRTKTLFSTEGEPVQIIGTMLDITEQHDFEEQLKQARDTAEAATESKSKFLANMSHEIRTPMSAILGYADILERHLRDPDDLNCISIIRSNGRFLLEIINDILDISKIEAGKVELSKKIFRIDRLIADVQSLIYVRAKDKRIDFSVQIEETIPQKIKSDSKRLKQILINLIDNAIKFTDSGSVQLVVRHLPNEEPSQIQFEIIDTGIGISEQHQQKLFQSFFQADASADRKFGGTGLGLAISRRLAEMLGGEINVESELGKGSTFSFTIAIGNLQNVAVTDNASWDIVAPMAQKPLTDKPKLTGRILVVDDRREIRFIAQDFIEDAGGTVTTADNGQEAIDAIQKAEADGTPFDLLVIDMQMPILNGYETARRLRASGFDKPIIALTAHAMDGDREDCLAAGCTDYISKPLDGSTFTDLLHGYLTNVSVSEEFKRRKILIVDDGRQAAEAMSKLLTLKGYEARVAFDGCSGIELATQFEPEIVLLDLGLPDMTGFEALDRLREIPALSATAFIAATGRDNSAETLAAGFQHHIIKPIDVGELEVWIKKSNR